MQSKILKISLFATGIAGIASEYTLSTLASYLLGDSIFQWSIILSIMLFAMGVGSRLSKFLKGNLMQKFIWVEFALSLLVSFVALFSYTSAAYTDYTAFFIYTQSALIGMLIGLEIPLVMRLNKEFEELKINVANVMEKDYLGSLVGGLFFAFVGLPYLGLTYTPFILGIINFLVAVAVLIVARKSLSKRLYRLNFSFFPVILLCLAVGILNAKPIIRYTEQKQYQDQVIYSKQSKYQKITITQWKNDYWLYINSNLQLCTQDEYLYHEPLVHPAMSLLNKPTSALILGGGDGCAVRELLKYPSLKEITLVDLDPVMTQIAKDHPVLRELNDSAFYSPKVSILHQDGFKFVQDNNEYYDVIIIDLPDPKSVELGRLYSVEFYRQCHRLLRPHGVIITQAGSPYYATRAFVCIQKTMQAAGFSTVLLHNQVLSLGQWGWSMGVKDQVSNEMIKEKLRHAHFDSISTIWINNEAMQLITSFGKNIVPEIDTSEIKINRVNDPVLYHYYLKGNWDLY